MLRRHLLATCGLTALVKPLKIATGSFLTLSGSCLSAVTNMLESEIPETPRTPWYLIVVRILIIPLLLPYVLLVFVIIIALGLYATIHNRVCELSLRRRMKRCGRFLLRHELSDRIAVEGPGTLIVEFPSMGWRFTHAWWTHEKTRALCPFPLPSHDDYRRTAETEQSLDWDRWYWDNYTDPTKGRALLLRVWNGHTLEKWVRQTYPAADVVHTYTAFVHETRSTTLNRNSEN